MMTDRFPIPSRLHTAAAVWNVRRSRAVTPGVTGDGTHDDGRALVTRCRDGS